MFYQRWRYRGAPVRLRVRTCGLQQPVRHEGDQEQDTGTPHHSLYQETGMDTGTPHHSLYQETEMNTCTPRHRLYQETGMDTGTFQYTLYQDTCMHTVTSDRRYMI